MKVLLKTHTSKEFPRDFWNYHVNPITGFSTLETSPDEEKECKKYFKTSQNLGI